MGRLGVWTVAQRDIAPPNIALVDPEGSPAPPWANVVAARGDRPRGLTLGLAGSFFVPAAPGGDIPLPERSGLPPGMEIEMPREAVRGSAAIVSSVAQAPATADLELVVLEGGPSHLDRPKEFARTIVEARTKFGAGRVLAVPGIAAPHNLGVLVYCGIDLLDSSRIAYDSARGLFHTADGAVPRDSLEEVPCTCPSCASGGPLLDHNDHMLNVELAVARTAIRHGTLRELAERRAGDDPWAPPALPGLDPPHYDFPGLHFPLAGGAGEGYSPRAPPPPGVVRVPRVVSPTVPGPPSPRGL